MLPKLLLGLNTNLAICFCVHTGILKNPVVLLGAEENHSILCREQSCSLFSFSFFSFPCFLLLCSERWRCSFPLAAPPGHDTPPGQHRDTQAPLVCSLGNILIGTQRGHPVELCANLSTYGKFLSSGQRQGWPGGLCHHLHQNRLTNDPHALHRPCWKSLRRNVF